MHALNVQSFWTSFRELESQIRDNQEIVLKLSGNVVTNNITFRQRISTIGILMGSLLQTPGFFQVPEDPNDGSWVDMNICHLSLPKQIVPFVLL